MRIFDTFPFDGELALLAHRLRQNFDLVDAFVIVEAAQTYRGKPKPLTFDEHRDDFAWAMSKILHVRLDSLGPPDAFAKQRAAVQRNATMLALEGADPDDIVLLLDADEIPSASALERLRHIERPTRLAMTRHYQWLDMLGPASPCCPQRRTIAAITARPEPWDELGDRWFSHSGVATPFIVLKEHLPFEVRYGTSHDAVLPHAGRHFSSVDPSTRLDRKLDRVFHEEWSGVRATRASHVRRTQEHGVHHRGWWLAQRPAGSLPDDLAGLAPAVSKAGPLPPDWKRRAVLSWAWMRTATWLPDEVVNAIDERFETLMPVVAPLLLAIHALRTAVAIFSSERASDSVDHSA